MTSSTLFSIGCLLVIAGIPAHGSGNLSHTFAPGNLHGWGQIVIAGGDPEIDGIRFHATGGTFGNRMLWQDPTGDVGGLTVPDAPVTADYRSAAHNSAILRSPAFVVDGANPSAGIGNLRVTGISFSLLGGTGTATGPASVDDIPTASVAQTAGNFAGYLGVALRRDDDDEYLLWRRRGANAQGTNWQSFTLTASELAAATAGDPPGTLYTIDLVDAAHGDWGWVAMDSLTFSGESSLSTVSVSLLDRTGAETGPNQDLKVRFSRTGDPVDPLTLRYAVSGTAVESVDFEALPGFVGPGYEVTIPAGQDSVDLTVTIIPNSVPEFDRSLEISILGDLGYLIGGSNSTTLWISDFPSDGPLSVAAPFGTTSWLAFGNPIQDGVAGSLFLYGEVELLANGFVVLGLRPEPLESTARGGFDIGRNTNTAPFAVFDYFDNKNAASGAARVGGSPEVPITAGGRYTMIAELEVDGSGGGILRGWVRDGVNGSLDFESHNVTTTFSDGFDDAGEMLYVRLDSLGGAGAVWKNIHVRWVEGTDLSDIEAGFASLAPNRPFIFLDTPEPVGGEFGDENGISFRLSRSGRPDGVLEIPLNFSGTASADDFESLPGSVTLGDGQSSVTLDLTIVPDDLIEGPEFVSIELSNTNEWLVRLPTSPQATLLDRPVQNWMFERGLASVLIDSDGNGQSNLLEYFLGSDPLDAASRGEFGLAPEGANVLRVTRNPLAVDASARVEWSTDLVTWRGHGESDGFRTVEMVETVLGLDESGNETVEVAAEVTGDEAPRLFLRLAVDLE